MGSLFGIPTTTLALVMVVFVAGVSLVLLALAARHWILVKMSLRNIARRPRQSALIIFGLMLSTMLITASLGLGDSVGYSVKTAQMAQVGNLDEGLSKQLIDDPGQAFTSPTSFSPGEAQQVSTQIQANSNVDKVAGALVSGLEEVKAYDIVSQQISAENQVLAVPPNFDEIWGTLQNTNGDTVHFADLQTGQVYVGTSLARKLNVKAGDTLQLFLKQRTFEFTVRALLNADVNPDTRGNPLGKIIIMSLAQWQQLTNAPGAVNVFYIKNKGSGGLDDLGPNNSTSNAVTRTLQAQFPGYSVLPFKQNAVTDAEGVGATTILALAVVGLFVDVVSIFLVYLIFVMLAAERKAELGMSRAVGMKRRHLVQMFVFEGTAYTVVAALVGVPLGVGIVFLLAQAQLFKFSPDIYAIKVIHPYIAWPSLLISFCLGLLLTFLVVSFSAYRVSRTNIVAAIRDLDDQASRKKTGRLPAGGLICVFIGLALVLIGLRVRNTVYTVGVSILIIGIGLIVRWLMRAVWRKQEIADRVGFSLMGAGLFLYGVLPSGSFEKLIGVYNRLGLASFQVDNEVFFTTTILALAGAIWLVMYNGDILIKGVTAITNRLGRLAPVTRTSMAYPLNFKFRTGLAAAVFALITFMIIMVVVLGAAHDQSSQSQTQQVVGQWPLTSDSTNLPPDLVAQIKANPKLSQELDVVSWQYRQVINMGTLIPGTFIPAVPVLMRAANDTFLDNSHFPLRARGVGYTSDQQVWDAVKNQAGVAILGYGYGALPGVQPAGNSFHPFQVEFRDKQGVSHRLTVIGLLSDTFAWPGLYISTRTAASVLPGQAIVPVVYFFRPKPGADLQQVRFDLGAAFGLKYGMEPEDNTTLFPIDQAVNDNQTQFTTGYLILGLLIGIAALGVISSRTVVERRQQIGMLRALGYSRNLVQLSFLMEFSFIAILGLLIGAGIGIWSGYQLSNTAYAVNLGSWLVLILPVGLILLALYFVTLFATYLPARAAARIVPAQALRYE